MPKFAAAAVLATLVVAATAAAPAPALAGGWVDHRDAVAAGALGLVGGMIIGGALNAGPVYAAPAPVYVPVVDAADAHVAWCSGKYRSYSAYDNTWVDRSGRLRVCRSPYMR